MESKNDKEKAGLSETTEQKKVSQENLGVG